MSGIIIKLVELKQGPNELEFNLEPQDLHITELTLLKKVKVLVVVTKSGEKLHFKGAVEFAAEFHCAWCALRFEKLFQEKFEEEYLPGRLKPSVQPVGLVSQELNREYYTGETIDILPLVRDTILLAVPIAPVCREDCKGLCPVCGTNLNDKQCSCEREEVSSWKQALTKLKKDKL